MFSPNQLITQVPAMITPYNNDGVFFQPKTFQFPKDFANLGIYIANAGEIGMSQCPCIVV